MVVGSCFGGSLTAVVAARRRPRCVSACVNAIGIAWQHLVFFEREPDTPFEFAHRRVLLCCKSLEDNGENLALRALDGIDAEHLRIGDESILEILAVADIHGNVFQQFHYLVRVC